MVENQSLIIMIAIAIVVLCVWKYSISTEMYDPDPQIVYADYRMIPEFPTADHFRRNVWTRSNLQSDNDPFVPYTPYYGIAPYFEGGQ